MSNVNASTQRDSAESRETQRRRAFETAAKYVWIFGICNAITMCTVVAVAIAGGAPSTFMWVRASILLAAAPFLLWLTGRVRQGSSSALGRLRMVSTVLPIAVIVIDFIPGVAPIWYGVMQGIGALALIPVAVSCRQWTRRPTDV